MRRAVRRAAVLCAGGALVAAGVAMLVLPGPGLLVLPAGLAVLGREFEAPRRWRNALVQRMRSRL